MLSMDKQSFLYGKREFEGKSLNEIARETGHHFNTVKKYADREDWNAEHKPRKQRTSGLDPLKAKIDEWLEEDLIAPVRFLMYSWWKSSMVGFSQPPLSSSLESKR